MGGGRELVASKICGDCVDVEMIEDAESDAGLEINDIEVEPIGAETPRSSILSTSAL